MPNPLLTTPFHAMHIQAGAKMVPFAGYDMPVQYAMGVKQEHLQCRAQAGLFDVSHMGQLFIKGDNELTNDLEKIFPLDLKNISLRLSKNSKFINSFFGSKL